MKKRFRLGDVILSVICVVFVAEAAAPVASMGNSQFFWWIAMILAFLIPYGLISSELGTAYQGEGGLYDWVHRAYPGTKWGARASWWYWLNFPLWMASLAVMCPGLITMITGIELGPAASVLVQLAFVWPVTVAALFPVCDNIVILNVCAAIKVLLSLMVGGMGVYYVIQNGFVNNMVPATFLPSFDPDSLSYLSVILFNMLGFEIVCTFSGAMSSPQKQIPRAIIIGGVVIAAIYLFSGFGIGCAIPVDQINSDSGLMDAVMLMSGQTGGPFISAVALLLTVTLYGNMISWSMGVNSTAAYAADSGDMPRGFAIRSVKNRMPVGAALINGIVATAVVLLGAAMNLVLPDSSLFWSFFALNLVLFLMSYLPIFPAFLKLRRSDPNTRRPFRVPGSDGMLRVLAAAPVVIILASILFTAVPLSLDRDTLATTLPISIGSVICILIGEVLIALRRRK